MRRHHLSTLLLLPASITAITLDCAQIVSSGVKFDLSALGGLKTVHNQYNLSTPPTTVNMTYTLDICKPLTGKDRKKDERCPSGTRVCARRWAYRKGQEWLETVIPIAGDFTLSDGSNRALDPKFTRLKGSAGNSEDKEGVLVELHGGKFPPDDKDGKPEKAIIEFLCDKKVSGNEGFKSATSSALEPRADDDKPSFPDLDKGKSLQFLSYHTEDTADVLRLQWRTKYACEDYAASASSTAGWGFFTWLIIIVFLLAAAYIIFGSWLNYNRYGARGWDLIPHGDAIRDLPYLVKDFGSGIRERLKGDQGARGGYSAV